MLRGVIEHCPRPVDVVAEVSRVLRPGGYCYICATPNVDSIAASLYRSKWTLFHPVQHLWHFSPDTLELIFRKVGMCLVWKEFPYLNTPYENFLRDIREITAFLDGGDGSCPAFYESMMSLVFQKSSNS
jgi:SAM-dependent methyltransferase